MPKGSKPDYIARAKSDEDSDYMQTIGGAWKFKDSKKDGYVIKLNFIPTNWNGDFILVKPAAE